MKSLFNGSRKLLLGLAYLVTCAFLGWLHLREPGTPNLLGLGEMFVGLASGVTAIVWGNTKEHEHAATIATREIEMGAPKTS
jgi:hypothetical protein